MRVSAVAIRSRGWWAVEVPAVPGLFTQTRRRSDVPASVREAGAALGVRIEGVKVVAARGRPQP